MSEEASAVHRPDNLGAGAKTTQNAAPLVETKGLLARTTARIEAATQKQREKLAEERTRGDMALERSGMKLLTAEYDLAVEKFERFTHLETSFKIRAQKLNEQGGLFNKILGWANRKLASFFGWRARGAARTRDYYLAA